MHATDESTNIVGQFAWHAKLRMLVCVAIFLLVLLMSLQLSDWMGLAIPAVLLVLFGYLVAETSKTFEVFVVDDTGLEWRRPWTATRRFSWDEVDSIRDRESAVTLGCSRRGETITLRRCLPAYAAIMVRIRKRIAVDRLLADGMSWNTPHRFVAGWFELVDSGGVVIRLLLIAAFLVYFDVLAPLGVMLFAAAAVAMALVRYRAIVDVDRLTVCRVAWRREIRYDEIVSVTLTSNSAYKDAVVAILLANGKIVRFAPRAGALAMSAFLISVLEAYDSSTSDERSRDTT